MGKGENMNRMRRQFFVGDRVKVKSDNHGHIDGGVRTAETGTITEIDPSITTIDPYCGVKMDDGSFSFLKSTRLTPVY